MLNRLFTFVKEAWNSVKTAIYSLIQVLINKIIDSIFSWLNLNLDSLISLLRYITEKVFFITNGENSFVIRESKLDQALTEIHVALPGVKMDKLDTTQETFISNKFNALADQKLKQKLDLKEKKTGKEMTEVYKSFRMELE